MLPKITGYSSFQSYRDIEYPTLKVGAIKDPQVLWKNTQRNIDHDDILNNFHYNKTVYKKDYLQNTQPQHYEDNMIPPKPDLKFYGHRTASSVSNAGSDSKMACGHTLNQYVTGPQCKQKHQTQQTLKPTDKLKSGTQHWKSIYNKDYKTNKDALGQADSPQISTSGLAKSPSDKNSNLKGADAKANTSLGMDNKDEADARLKLRLISMASRTGSTEYKFSYGQRIGHCPNPDILNSQSVRQPKIKNQLKFGTTQLTEHIPGYQGFLPASQTISKAFQQAKGEKTRTTFLKNNLYQNYHLKVPGYTGHRPSAVRNVPQNLREKCLELS